MPSKVGGRDRKKRLYPPHPASERLLCQGDRGLGPGESPAPTPRGQVMALRSDGPREPHGCTRGVWGPQALSRPSQSRPVLSAGEKPQQPAWGVSQLPESSGLPAEPEIGSSECEEGKSAELQPGGEASQSMGVPSQLECRCGVWLGPEDSFSTTATTFLAANSWVRGGRARGCCWL